MSGTPEYDVVVVGSGAGGLVGALTAADAGLRALVVEKADTFGGTTALSGAGLWAPANLHVLAAGQPDSFELAREYLRNTVGDRTPQSMQDAFLVAAADVIAWLETKSVRFSYMTGYPDYRPDLAGALLTGRAITPKVFPHKRLGEVPAPVRPKLAMGHGGPPITDPGPEGPEWGGQSLIAQLLIACEAGGVDLWASTPFTDLVVEDGRVTGIRVLHDGEELAITARLGVLLASGGFERNEAMRKEHSVAPAARADWTLGVPENTGDGIRAGMALGAATDLLEDCWWAPGFVRPDGEVSFLLWERAAPGGIVVDRNGERWINEGTDYNTFGHRMLEAEANGRPAIPSWWVMDQHFVDEYGFGGLRPGVDTTPWVEAGALVRADTIEELAAAIGAPALVSTIERWNRSALAGVDEELGRGAEGSHERQLLSVFHRYPGIAGPHEHPNPCLAPIGDGPFYAGQVVLADLGTKGGLVCDESGHVLDKERRPLPGLYACGNTMASMMGHAYPGPGACITPAMAFGHVAVQNMAGSLDRAPA
ncbi:MAG: FAD-binding protein [Frankiaceae bacterium]|nr:FAD-binding protein [Frankiaceae bacterium]